VTTILGSPRAKNAVSGRSPPRVDPRARRRLANAHADVATALALWLRPEWQSTDEALRRAHRELDAAIAHDDGRPLLLVLVDRLA
jgi:hypothetical protein